MLVLNKHNKNLNCHTTNIDFSINKNHIRHCCHSSLCSVLICCIKQCKFFLTCAEVNLSKNCVSNLRNCSIAWCFQSIALSILSISITFCTFASWSKAVVIWNKVICSGLFHPCTCGIFPTDVARSCFVAALLMLSFLSGAFLPPWSPPFPQCSMAISKEKALSIWLANSLHCK